MPYTFRVRPHPLGVVVYTRSGELGELLIPGESCCGIPFEELTEHARTSREVAVPEDRATDCPLMMRGRRAA